MLVSDAVYTFGRVSVLDFLQIFVVFVGVLVVLYESLFTAAKWSQSAINHVNINLTWKRKKSRIAYNDIQTDISVFKYYIIYFTNMGKNQRIPVKKFNKQWSIKELKR